MSKADVPTEIPCNSGIKKNTHELQLKLIGGCSSENNNENKSLRFMKAEIITLYKIKVWVSRWKAQQHVS